MPLATRPRRSPWCLARSRCGRLFQGWMLVFLLLSAAVVAGAVPAQSQLLGLPGPMAVLYLLEALTVAALAATWRWHWAPSARAADRRLLQERAPLRRAAPRSPGA